MRVDNAEGTLVVGVACEGPASKQQMYRRALCGHRSDECQNGGVSRGGGTCRRRRAVCRGGPTADHRATYDPSRTSSAGGTSRTCGPWTPTPRDRRGWPETGSCTGELSVGCPPMTLVTLIPGDGIGPEVVESAPPDHRRQPARRSSGSRARPAPSVFKQGIASGVPQDTIDSIRKHAGRAQGPARDAGRLRREERQRHAAQAVRDLRQHPPRARVARRARRPTAAAASTWSSSARTSRTSTPASSTCRRPASPSA